MTTLLLSLLIGCEAPRLYTAEDTDELEAALGEALAHPGPSLVEIVSDPELI